MMKYPDPDPKEDLAYAIAMHGLQSGVAIEIGRLGEEAAGASPKHLRVGVNSALCDVAALAKLLIAKGVITEDEYVAAVRREANLERERRESRLRATLNTEIKLR